MSDYLPQEVLVEILSRLPVKSVLRFSCVSKSWRSLVTSPSFINAHLKQSANNSLGDHLVLLRYNSLNPKKEHYSLRFEDKTFNEYAEFKSPFKARFYFRIVGTCNGLICLSDDWFGDKHTTILWNPMIRCYVTLPMPIVTFDSCGLYMSVTASGFGFDSRTNDYKVVRIAYFHRRNNAATLPKVEVYSLRTGSWKAITGGACVPSYDMVQYFWHQVFLNGAAHWIGYKRNRAGDYHNVLLLFDMGDELFSDVELPEALASVLPLYLGLLLVGTMISATFVDSSANVRCVSVWVMKEYGVVGSWTKQYKVDLQGGLTMVFGVREGGELLLTTRGGDVVLYHPESKRVENLGMRGVKCSFYSGAYVESLVLLKGSNGDLQGRVNSYGLVDSLGDPVLPTVTDGEEVDERALETALSRTFLSAASLVTGNLLEFLLTN